ncbi:hypothetical protein TNCV_2279971 [Trichonephila clavipes]|nr:hypothetical protein TNCV_2279971 [Trichonephila clavipes]
MVMRERKGTIDGYEWRCRTKGGENPHGVCKSIRRGTWFSKSHLDHATRNCHIKERQQNPFCINCQDFGHSACYTKCPKFPQPKKAVFFQPDSEKKTFPVNGQKRELPSLTLLVEKSPARPLPKSKIKL